MHGVFTQNQFETDLKRVYSASVNGAIVLALCMINGQCRLLWISQLLYQNLHQVQKKILKTANKQSKHHKIQWKCQNLTINQGYNVFTFQVPNYATRQNTRSHCFYSLVSKPSKTTASTLHRMSLNQCESLGLYVTHQVTWMQRIAARSWDNILWVFIYIRVAAMSCWLE